jgi:16S rRNA (cytosine967-C5)-methyltransferase
MKPAAQLQTVIELLELISKEPRPSDTLLSAYFRSHRYIGSKDRSGIASRVYTILRHHARLNWWLEYLKHPVSARAIAIIHLRLVENQEAPEVMALFEGGKYAPALLKDEEKKLLSGLKGRTFFHPGMPEDIRFECPPWAYEKLKETLGENFEKEMLAMLLEAPLDLRVNELKTTREEALKALKEEKIEASATELSPLGIRVKGRPAVAQTSIFKKGWIEIQDEGSQMVALAANIKPGMSVVDFCAGAGGKTLALAARMKNKGRVIACDVLGGRLKRARERFKRAGLHNIEVRELSSEKDDWVRRNAGKHDVVLVDAPCSGTGVWRRNPDARWKNLGPGLDQLTALQARILHSAARLVKPGGQLIYATCSMLPEENERQVDFFIKMNPSFQKTESFSYTPAQHGTDGFFCAVMQIKT